jgi:valyl-tRNA synthetase
MQYPKISEIKNWTVEIEKTITKNWEKSEQFLLSKSPKKIYSIDTPPPYVNAPIHIGQAITYCYMDFFARYKRMKGFDVLFPLGLDRNGLPIEMGAEKKFKVSPFKVEREEFIKLCKKLLEETSTESTDTFSRLGISFTSYNEGTNPGSIYKTDSPEYRSLTQSTFIDLYRKGLVYEDKRINNWDSKLQTTIADSEIEYKDIPSTFTDIKWKIKETGEGIVIGTTRPELICSCGMIIYNPKDKRYQKLLGKTAISPIYGKEIPITEHPLADPEKGTGIVMMCSAGDLSDIQFFREKNITPTISINKDGTMNEYSGFLKGLKVKEAREKILNELKSLKLIKNQEHISHRTPISERSKAEIEFIEMPEFYLKQLEFKNKIKEISNKINFFPKESKLILDRWLDSISIDWPISRRRFYATPIPLWHSKDLTALPPEGKYYTPWKESPPKNSEIFKNGKFIGLLKDYPKSVWKPETRVFDTWMDSSISDLFILKYKSDPKFFKKAFPSTLRPQGKEIVRTWLYYTLLRGYLETEKPCFRDVWIHNHILDQKGKKMAKSVGNIINPQDLLRDYGAEAIRLWAATEGDLSKQDLKCEKEKINSERKTLNKLLNVAKFISQFKKPKSSPKLTSLDRLFIDYIEELTIYCDTHYDDYDFHYPSLRLRRFLWDKLASHYLELIKNRAYNEEKKFTDLESKSAKYTLHYLLERLIILLYPINPQITSVIANSYNLDLTKIKFPKANPTSLDLINVQKIMEFNSEIWKNKKDLGISLKSPIKKIKIPKNLEPFKKDLIACHNLE